MDAEEYIFVGLIAVLGGIVGCFRNGFDPTSILTGCLTYCAVRHGVPATGRVLGALGLALETVNRREPPPAPPTGPTPGPPTTPSA